jgi:hypothetical protein
MAVAFVTGSAGSWQVSPGNTGSFTVGSETDKVLIAVTTIDTATESVSGVVWDPTGVNEAFTAAAAVVSSGNFKIRFWYLINPTAATAAVRATGTDVIGSAAVIAGLFSGVHQTTPISVADITSANGTGTALTVTVPNASADDMIMDGVVAVENPLTLGANQTRIGTTQAPNDNHTGSYQDGADGGVMSYTASVSGNWFMAGARIVPTASGSTMTPDRGALTFTGTGLGLGFTINMPDEL